MYVVSRALHTIAEQKIADLFEDNLPKSIDIVAKHCSMSPKEIVDFDEFIGYYCDKETGKLYPSTTGSIDYAKDGVHIIPRKPRIFNP
ncbi:MAG: hypothetical protein S4CHLAM45_06500 [Chlamydiales bacterium]|nr:hypothetical protein [Chlamydiales bacterium]MCH9622762.1 hypothetical protein [Chlamydiales bacterium]